MSVDIEIRRYYNRRKGLFPIVAHYGETRHRVVTFLQQLFVLVLALNRLQILHFILVADLRIGSLSPLVI